jgi:hypothetical protein
MATSEGSGADAPRNSPTILSRDVDGNEHALHVDDRPAGMISIADDEIIRILAPNAAVALVLELLHALGGPISAPLLSQQQQRRELHGMLVLEGFCQMVWGSPAGSPKGRVIPAGSGPARE